ncbi:hypothetical protein E2C01_023235 [Portunus trituberculatus]|uniref:Uncharacterized protein n=1 Tax=Portunus trituberculatus TaxID=210409 RepID=A0A5B7E7G5_PORTR|nr:hypothetical protein [Portunus trituberculatus]
MNVLSRSNAKWTSPRGVCVSASPTITTCPHHLQLFLSRPNHHIKHLLTPLTLIKSLLCRTVHNCLTVID